MSSTISGWTDTEQPGGSLLLAGKSIDQLQVRYEKLVYGWKLPSFIFLLPVSLLPPAPLPIPQPPVFYVCCLRSIKTPGELSRQTPAALSLSRHTQTCTPSDLHTNAHALFHWMAPSGKLVDAQSYSTHSVYETSIKDASQRPINQLIQSSFSSVFLFSAPCSSNSGTI